MTYPEGLDVSGDYRTWNALLFVLAADLPASGLASTIDFLVDSVGYTKSGGSSGDFEFVQESPSAESVAFAAIVLPLSPEKQNQVAIQQSLNAVCSANDDGSTLVFAIARNAMGEPLIEYTIE